MRHREVTIANFYPSDSIYDGLVSLLPRLEERADLHASLAKTRVLGDDERDLCDIEEGDVGLVRKVYGGADYAQVLEALLPTSKHLVDRANATDEQTAAALALDIGVRSAKQGTDPGILALLRHQDSLHCVFQAANGPNSISPEEMPHEVLLRHVACDAGTPSAPMPRDMDERLTELVTSWGAARNVDPDDLTIVVAIAVVPLDGAGAAG